MASHIQLSSKHIVIGSNDTASCGCKVLLCTKPTTASYDISYQSLEIQKFLPTETKKMGPVFHEKSRKYEPVEVINIFTKGDTSDPLISFVVVNLQIPENLASLIACILMDLIKTSKTKDQQLYIISSLNFSPLSSQHESVHFFPFCSPTFSNKQGLPQLDSGLRIGDVFISSLLHLIKVIDIPTVLFSVPGQKTAKGDNNCDKLANIVTELFSSVLLMKLSTAAIAQLEQTGYGVDSTDSTMYL